MHLRRKNIPEKNNKPEPSETGAPKDRKYLLLYSLALFSAALFLVLITYIVQEKNNQKLISEYESSRQHSVETVAQLKQNNADLQVSLSELQTSLDQAGESLTEKNYEIDTLEDSLHRANLSLDEAKDDLADALHTQNAMMLLLQLEVSYSSYDYDTCRDIIVAMEEDDLVSGLPEEAASPLVTQSPLAIYHDIKDMLN